jgi:hypothetical protein
MVNDADGVIYVKLTVKIVNYAVNRQSLVTVTPLFTIVIYGAIFNDAVCAQHCLRHSLETLTFRQRGTHLSAMRHSLETLT